MSPASHLGEEYFVNTKLVCVVVTVNIAGLHISIIYFIYCIIFNVIAQWGFF